jgi:hypothetical protein
MGLFKKLKRAFKKVVKGIGNGIKKTLSAINKVQKKIRKSKLFKALVIAAAVVVTGGAALSAMGATTGAGLFGSAAAAGGTGFAGWMTGTAASLTSTTVGAALATPFTALGTAIGSTAVALGVPAISNAGAAATTATSASTALTASQSAALTPGVNPATIAAGTPTGVSFTGIPTTAATPGLTSTATSSIAAGTDALTGQLTALSSTTPATIAAGTPTGVALSGSTTAAEASASFASKYPRTTKFLSTVGTGVATSVATGYAMQQIAGDPELQGSMSGLRTEGATQFDPLRIYAAERGIADTDISKYFTFGNTAEAGNMPLFQQQTIGIA